MLAFRWNGWPASQRNGTDHGNAAQNRCAAGMRDMLNIQTMPRAKTCLSLCRVIKLTALEQVAKGCDQTVLLRPGGCNADKVLPAQAAAAYQRTLKAAGEDGWDGLAEVLLPPSTEHLSNESSSSASFKVSPCCTGLTV